MSGFAKQIFIIDDSPDINTVIRESCRQLRVKFKEYSIGNDATSAACIYTWNLLIINTQHDIHYAIKSCKTVRQVKPLSQIIVVSNKKEEFFISNCLSHGADDYITTPFSEIEFQARVSAALRRSIVLQPLIGNDDFSSAKFKSAINPNAPKQQVHSVDQGGMTAKDVIQVFPASKKVNICGITLSLTQTELLLLSYLGNNLGRPCSKYELLENVLGYADERYLNSLYSHFNRLRRKLRNSHLTTVRVETVWRYGYRLVVEL